jgi:hypothetical protein
MGANGTPQVKTSTSAQVRQKTVSLRAEAASDAIGGREPIRLIYYGWLPKTNGHQVNKFARSRLTKKGRAVFGVLPPMLYPQCKAHVDIIRVLGPGQKPMDDDSIALLTGGLRDALVPSWIRDDSPKFATFTYVNDGTRRDMGPCILIEITYEGRGLNG